jgi:hypothetical protein
MKPSNAKAELTLLIRYLIVPTPHQTVIKTLKDKT